MYHVHSRCHEGQKTHTHTHPRLLFRGGWSCLRVDRWWRAFNAQSPACNGNAVAVLRPHIGIERRSEKKSAVFVTFSARGVGKPLREFYVLPGHGSTSKRCCFCRLRKPSFSSHFQRLRGTCGALKTLHIRMQMEHGVRRGCAWCASGKWGKANL